MRSVLYRTAIAMLLVTGGLSADVVVSPGGSDGNPGTAASPVQTLEQARNLIRAQGGGTVWLRGGEYPRTSTLTLSSRDAGTVWRSWPNEKAVITGGRGITGFLPSGAPGVYQTSLPAQGITNYGKLTARGFGRANQASALELFYQGSPMPLAGWPDVGWAYTSGAPNGAQGGMFTVSTSRIARWQNEPDLWVHGYWTYDWADSHEHVASVDAAHGIIRTSPPHGVYGYAAQKRFRVENALSELDSPGEWYLDRSSGMLYFYPPGPISDGDAAVSLIDTPLISVSNGSNIRIFDLTFEYARANAIEIRGGSNVAVSWCFFHGIGIMAVSVVGGSNHLVEYSEIYDTGEGGILLNGGDRPSLTRGNHVAQWNRVSRYNRWVRTYRPAIALEGVGQSAWRNRLDHAPHQAVAIDGNDHLIEGNDIHSVGWETADVGAFYMGRDLTWRGNIVRSNFFHNLGNNDVNAVYLDDCTGGTLVEGNQFHRAGRNVLIGGGRDNILRNNLSIDGTPVVQVDARGTTWAQYWFNGKDQTLMNRLNAMPYKTPPWSDRYPALANILNDEPALPKGNILDNNALSVGQFTTFLDNTRRLVQQTRNVTSGDFGFVNPASNNFRLRGDSYLYALGFQPLNFLDLGEIGDVVNYRLVAVPGQANQVHLIVENLGHTRASGQILFWTWPEEVQVASSPVSFNLGPGERLDRQLTVLQIPASGSVYAGVRLKGDDLTPLPLVLR